MSDLIQKDLILLNITEAREQLQEIEESLNNEEEFTEIELKLKIDLENAYHHLNFAWNIRKLTDDEVARMTEHNFSELSKYPGDDILEYE